MAVVDNVKGRLEEVSAALGVIEATSNYANSSSGPFKREAAMVVAFYADARRYLGRTASGGVVGF